MNTRLISIDLAKDVFQICALNQRGKVVTNKRVNRRQLWLQLARYAPTEVVMEACYSAHYWGRVIEAMGHTVHLIPPQHVKPFVRGNKNDANDAVAIAEAAQRPKMRFVPVKNLAQQDIQMLHRIRQRHVWERTALVNQMRGLLSEYGIRVSPGWRRLQGIVPYLLEDAENELTAVGRQCIARLQDELTVINARIKEDEQALLALVADNEDYQHLLQVPGFGPIVASALVAAVGNAHAFSNARELPAWLGLTPRQIASGPHSRMVGISKRRNRYLRTLLIHGARTVVNWCQRKTDPLSLWVKKLIERRGRHKAIVALVHKLARFAWAILARKEPYRPPAIVV